MSTIYESVSRHDVQCAADEFRLLYDKTDGHDGYVSLEVNPHLAHDAKGTIEEGRRLWGILGRPHVFIKVPATTAGLSAIQELTREGINVNVTLLFGLPRYRQVVDAYLTGIAERFAHGKPVNHVVSVVSLFVNRIDSDPKGSLTQDVEKARSVLERLSEVGINLDQVTQQLEDDGGNGAPIDGLKVSTESGWFAARPSGTEDIYKVYAESFRGTDHLRRILEEAQAIVGETLATGNSTRSHV